MKLPLLAVVILLGCTASPVMAQNSAAELCSTTVQADAVIAGAGGGEPLVSSVARSVPTDPPNCIPSYCEAVRDETEKVKVAVGAGISEALSVLAANEDESGAAALLDGACSGRCDEIVITALAASQATTISRLCETAYGGASGSAPSLLQIDSGAGAGGGQSASDN